jgi:hypothetical protein
MKSLSLVVLVSALIMYMVIKSDAQCTLVVPNNPLTAEGLASLYLLSGDGCDETSANTAVFVESAIYRPSNGKIFLYSPLVVNAGDPFAAVPPTVPQLHNGDVVGLWFGSNSMSITLTSAAGGNGFEAGNCVNGGPTGTGVFGQVAFCNAVQFFAAANHGIKHHRLRIPPLGRGTSGQQCPSTRSFSVVDQDQSDNVLTAYLVVPTNGGRQNGCGCHGHGHGHGNNGNAAPARLAQFTVPNRQRFSTATEIDNGSDNRLLGDFINPALGCPTWTATDLSDPTGQTVRNSQVSYLSLQFRRLNRCLSPNPLI